MYCKLKEKLGLFVGNMICLLEFLMLLLNIISLDSFNWTRFIKNMEVIGRQENNSMKIAVLMVQSAL